MLLHEPTADLQARNTGCEAPTRPNLLLLSAIAGSRTLELQGRTLVIDPDCYLLTNHAVTAPVDAADGTLLLLKFSAAQLRIADDVGEMPNFPGHLRLIEEPLASQLARVKRDVRSARHQAEASLLDDLLRSLVNEEMRLQRRAQAIDCVKSSTRRELVRRVLLASDFILSRHAEPIRLDDVALAAHLSRFHLVRLFRQLLGVTPHTLLLNKRLATARRLLADGRSDMNQIAERSGFGNRWSLFRRLQRYPVGAMSTRRPPTAELTESTAASD